MSSAAHTPGDPSSQAALILPARLESTRLARKLLLDETGRPLLAHTVRRALEVLSASEGRISRVLVAADCDELAAVARDAGAEAVLTDPNHRSGTDRIAEAAAALPEEAVINLQADEPEIPVDAVLQLADLLFSKQDHVMATLATPLLEEVDVKNPNIVKVVLDSGGHALYFSRAPVPYAREGWSEDRRTTLALRHLGIYAYRRQFLLDYSSLPSSRLEENEKLEQLRALEAGYRIACAVVDPLPEGIDTPGSYAAFVERWKARH